MIIDNLTLKTTDMVRTLVISILAFFMTAAAPGAKTVRQTLLRDGFVLRGIDGKLTKQDSLALTEGEPKLNRSPTRWFFEFGSDVTDYRVLVKAGRRLELLPSTTLEKMIADANERSAARPIKSKPPGVTAVPNVQASNGASYRLWGRVTKYKGKNFIFPTYFLPFVETAKPPPQTSKIPKEPQKHLSKLPETASVEEQKLETATNDPNDILKIPKEIIEKLKTRKAVQPMKLPEPPKPKKRVEEDSESKEKHETEPEPKRQPEFKPDYILADRTALLAKQNDSQFVFTLDALGRNVQQVSLRLLPCEALELTERKQSTVPEPLRFKIAGIMTEYKGSSYLLLQKATRVYSHENFDR